jgi:hopanoid-associated phosphorylase
MTSSPPVLGIVTALRAEARCLGIDDAPVGELVRVSDEVLLIRCGLGRARAERAALDLREAGVTALLGWGTAAALSRGIDHGDLVLARDVVTRDGQHLGVDSAWHRRLWEAVEAEGRCHTGTIAETGEVLADADDKLRLHTLSGALVADMESGAVAEVADGAGLPVLLVRAVSDSVSTRVPGCALAAVDDDGDVDPMRCLWRLLRAPAELPSLIRLAGEFRAACARLTRLAEHAGPDFLVASGKRADGPQA